MMIHMVADIAAAALDAIHERIAGMRNRPAVTPPAGIPGDPC
jgi:hypothetical protein